MKKREPQPKKNPDAYQRQVRRNQILFSIMAAVLILSMIISLVVNL